MGVVVNGPGDGGPVDDVVPVHPMVSIDESVECARACLAHAAGRAATPDAQL
jgi:hypothetical protein